ncbi:DUF6603 domain-containing protein [Kitasatospora sp. HPMI-4]|uniref:DUF6603 domain-containing protein n=1 Tax=Kitasatospora sp. HPMI-4 TaxID=3448443 RepID=UPI003F1DB80C
MARSVQELVDSFPPVGQDFTLSAEHWELPELYALVGTAGKELVLRTTEVAAERLRVVGRAALLGGARTVEVALDFAADAQRELVVGLTARVDGLALALVELAAAWEVSLGEAPGAFLGELARLSAHYDLVGGAVAVTAETDQLRVAFAAPGAGGPLTALVGLKGTEAHLSALPYVGELIPDGESIGVRTVELAALGPGGLTADQCVAVNTAVAAALPGESDWPLLPEAELAGGLWVGASAVLPGDDTRVWLVRLGVPDLSWLPGFPSIRLGRFTLSGFGLSSSGGGGGSGTGLNMAFGLSVDLGRLTVTLPEAGFAFDLPGVGAWSVVPRLPAQSFAVPDLPALPALRFETIDGSDGQSWPGFPGFAAPGLPTGWCDRPGLGVLDLVRLLGIELPALPSWFDPALTGLGLRLDLRTGDFALTADTERLRLVLGSLPAGPDWSLRGTVALLGVKGLRAVLSELPFIGGLLGNIDDFLLDGLSLSAIGTGLGLDAGGRLNGWLTSLGALTGSWWPTLAVPSGGGSGGGGGWRPGLSLDIDWRLPGPGSAGWGIPWPPPVTPPDLSWLPDLPTLSLGPLHVSGIGLSWPAVNDEEWTGGTDWVLRLVLDATFDLGGGFTLGLPGLGFDLDLKAFTVRPRFPVMSLHLPGGVTMDFTVPTAAPPWPVAVTAHWEDEEGVPATELARFLGIDVADDAIPEMLLPRLYAVGLHYDFSTYLLVVTAATEHFGWAMATVPANTPQRRNLLAVRAAVEAKASDLPVIVEPTSPDRDITLAGIHLVYAEQPFSAADITKLNAILTELNTHAGGRLPVVLAGDLDKGVLLWAVLTLGTTAGITLTYPDREIIPAADTPEGGALAGGPPGANTDLLGWAIGAARFSGARLSFGFGLLYLALDATFALGPLEFQLIGLGIGIDKNFQARPMLEGAAVAFSTPGPPKLELSGSLARLDLGSGFELALAGHGRIEIPNLFTLTVAGSWSRSREGWTSLFAYAELVAGHNQQHGIFAIGPVTVTGLALGFGINSTVRTPTIADVGTFPLIKRLGARSTGGGEPDKLTPAQALGELAGPGGWVTPAQGRYWVAGGAQFTVYKFIAARALVLVEWGQGGWKALLTGTTTLALPPTVPSEDSSEAFTAPATEPSADPTAAPRLAIIGSIGQVIVDYVFVFDSALGRFSMDAVLADGSYIIDKAAKLTGGISLYVWGRSLPEQGVDKGFVLSAGGYHPQFPAPRHYPQPPRIGWLWERGPITMKAHAYAALTDGAFMIGGAFAAVYDGKHGVRVQAWFTAYLDALVQWKPFYADLALGLSIGVAASVKVAFVRIRVSLEVGVDLQLWLPPIGGRARVKVWFVSFTLGFGADRKGPPPIPWEQFRIQIPAPQRTALKQGCALPDVTTGESEARAARRAPALVRIDGFAVTVESALPASRITVNGDTLAATGAGSIDIRPMGLTGVVSEQHVRITGPDGREFAWADADWTITPVRQGMPQALWGRPLGKPGDALTQPGLVPDCLTGLEITAPAPGRGGSVGPVSAAALDVEEVLPRGATPLRDTAVAGRPPVTEPGSIDVITDTLTATAPARTAVHRALAALGAAAGSDGPLTRYATLAGRTLTDAPLLTDTGAR